jgi:hypothetical protein
VPVAEDIELIKASLRLAILFPSGVASLLGLWRLQVFPGVSFLSPGAKTDGCFPASPSNYI